MGPDYVSKLELIEHNQGPNYVWLILILIFYVLKHEPKMTHSWIVEQNQKNCRNKNCQISHLLQNDKYFDENNL